MIASPHSVSEVLAAAADLISAPDAWTQGQCARGDDEAWPFPADDSATCWCGVGAVMRIAYCRLGQSSQVEADAIEMLHGLAKQRGLSAFAAFNDAPERTQAEVVDALRQAARQASNPTAEGV